LNGLTVICASSFPSQTLLLKYFIPTHCFPGPMVIRDMP
jgi:hypothetical protein